MKGQNVILCVALVLLSNCKQTESHNVDTSLRDSVIRKFFSQVESANNYTTVNVNYQFLKAYVDNDTTLLLELNRLADIEKSERETTEKRDSFLHLLPLRGPEVVEAYRFDYWEAFCSNEVSITISRKEDSIYLHFLRFTPQYKGGYKILKESDKLINQVEWDKFLNLIRKADFWGLKATNDYSGFDGDGLTVTGYKLNYPNTLNGGKSSRVYRWSVWSSTLAEPYYYLLKLSGGNKDTCTNGL